MEVSVTSHAGADVRAGSCCPALVIMVLSLPCHHPTTGAASFLFLSVPVLAAPQLSLPAQEPRGTEATAPSLLWHSLTLTHFQD